MGFNELSNGSENDLVGNKPWVNEFAEEKGRKAGNQFYSVIGIKTSVKGFILITDVFVCWVWRKSTLGITLTGMLDQAIRQDLHPSLLVKVKSSVKEKFICGVDDETLSKWRVTEDSNLFTITPQSDNNPTLEYPPEEPEKK